MRMHRTKGLSIRKNKVLLFFSRARFQSTMLDEAVPRCIVHGIDNSVIDEECIISDLPFKGGLGLEYEDFLNDRSTSLSKRSINHIRNIPDIWQRYCTYYL